MSRKKSFLLLIAFILSLLDVSRIQAQELAADSLSNLVEILGASQGRIVVENGEKVQYLTGGVRLRQKGTLFFANRASNYDGRGQVILEGRVRIVEKTDTLWADRVDYNSFDKIGKASSNVRLSDGEAVLNSESATYNISERWASFDQPIHLEDSTIVLESLEGAYDLNQKIAYFQKEVVLYEESSTIYSDSLTHYRSEGVSDAVGNVSVHYKDVQSESEDSTFVGWEELSLYGDVLNYVREDSISRMSGNTFAMQVRHDSTSSDTLGIRAEAFLVHQTSKVDSMIADGQVQLWSRDYQSKSDSLAYIDFKEMEREKIELLQEPILWYGENQITGDSLQFDLIKQEIDSLIVRQNAFVASRDTSINRFNQSRSVDLFGKFKDQEPESFVFMPAAEAVFFQTDSTDVSKLSAIKLSSDRIKFHFIEGEIAQVTALKNEGLYYESGSVPDDLGLPGFNWLEEGRPSKEKVLPILQSGARIFRKADLEKTDANERR